MDFLYLKKCSVALALGVLAVTASGSAHAQTVDRHDRDYDYWFEPIGDDSQYYHGDGFFPNADFNREMADPMNPYFYGERRTRIFPYAPYGMINAPVMNDGLSAQEVRQEYLSGSEYLPHFYDRRSQQLEDNEPTRPLAPDGYRFNTNEDAVFMSDSMGAATQQDMDNILSIFESVGNENQTGTYDNSSLADFEFDMRGYIAHECFELLENEVNHCETLFGPYADLKDTLVRGDLKHLLSTRWEIDPIVLSYVDVLTDYYETR